MDDTRDKIAAALKSVDNRKLDDALHDWLAGLSTDTELAEQYDRLTESADLQPAANRR